MKTSYSIVSENITKTYLLMAIFIGILMALGYFFAYVLNQPFVFYLSIFFGILMNMWTYFYGHKFITYLTGAKEVNKNELPEIYQILENLSITAGLPKTPKLYLINTPLMNAFATGRNYQNSLVAVTSGLIENLEKKEIEGVIAHELAHIKNRDITVMMVSSVLMGIIVFLADIFLRINIYNDQKNKNSLNPIFLAIGFVLALFAPIFAQLIHLAISRKREFIADATGVLFTRYPEGLANALEKIANQINKSNTYVSPALASLFIINPFKNKKGFTNWLGNLFSTHPPVEERIKLLRNMVL